MKIGILADIHENVEKLRGAIEVLRRHEADRFVALGDICDVGQRMDETISLLREVSAIGVWGNHDFGLCFDVSKENKKYYRKNVLEFMGGMKPRLEIEGCLFMHIEPWLDPTNIEDLWYFEEEILSPQEELDRNLAAAPNRLTVIGHFHQWFIGNTSGVIPWHGERPIRLDFNERYFVKIDAVCRGYCALLDTSANVVVPFKIS